MNEEANFYSQCGATVTLGAKFCSNCGYDLQNISTMTPVVTPTINREKFIEFLERDKNAAEFFINLISQNRDVDIDLIEQYGDQLNWKRLSDNRSLPWSKGTHLHISERIRNIEALDDQKI
jgi:hypothetical protein